MHSSHHLESPAVGLADPVHDSQQLFRHALSALAEPGRLNSVPVTEPLAPLHGTTYGVCLTLLDHETPLWISPALDGDAVRRSLAFHCACPVTGVREQARFALLGAQDASDLAGFPVGTDRDPHEACTLIIQLDALEGGSPSYWQGPGIPERRRMALPLPDAFWTARRTVSFPRGLDVIFAAPGGLVGLPRSTRVVHSMTQEP
ncbi:MAG: phosphonate C-P lyase system protein PhnH [Burkholderiaceae bacterium]